MRMGRAFDSFRRRVSSLLRSRTKLDAIQDELAYIAKETLAMELGEGELEAEAEEAEPEEAEPEEAKSDEAKSDEAEP